MSEMAQAEASTREIPELTESKTPQGPGWRWTLTAPLWLIPSWALAIQYLPLTPFTTLAGWFILAVCLVCSYTDIRWGKIRNTVTYPALLAAFLLAAFDTLLCKPLVAETLVDAPASASWGILGETGARLSPYLGSVSLGASLLGALGGFLIMVVIYHIAGGGAGDVKLAAVLGAFVGPAAIVDVILWTYISAGLAIFVWLIVVLGPVKVASWIFRKFGARFFPGFILPPTGDEYGIIQGKIRLAPFFSMGVLAVLTDVNGYLQAFAGV